MQASRYGDARNCEVDMVHMKGASGKVAFTRSVAKILADAGLTTTDEAKQVGRNMNVVMKKTGGDEFRSQGRKGKQGRNGPRQPQFSTFQIATQNRWSGFQGNL